jgi:hypothetical protein
MPLEQPVPPRVPYGSSCLLIRDAIGSVLLDYVGKGTMFSLGSTWCKRGQCWRNLSTVSGALGEETVAKHDILLY